MKDIYSDNTSIHHAQHHQSSMKNVTEADGSFTLFSKGEWVPDLDDRKVKHFAALRRLEALKYHTSALTHFKVMDSSLPRGHDFTLPRMVTCGILELFRNFKSNSKGKNNNKLEFIGCRVTQDCHWIVQESQKLGLFTEIIFHRMDLEQDFMRQVLIGQNQDLLPSFESLTISKSYIQVEAMVVLRDVLLTESLKELNLMQLQYRNAQEEKGATDLLIEGLRSNKSLLKLGFGYLKDRFSESFIVQVLESLIGLSSITHLVLEHTICGNQTLKVLNQVLSHPDCKIKTLEISKAVPYHGELRLNVDLLLDGVTQCSTLTSLSLKQNFLCNDDWIKILLAVDTCGSLSEIDLSRNEISKLKVSTPSHSRYNWGLMTLDLTRNPILTCATNEDRSSLVYLLATYPFIRNLGSDFLTSRLCSQEAKDFLLFNHLEAAGDMEKLPLSAWLMVVDRVSQSKAHSATDKIVQRRQKACKATLLFGLLTSSGYLGDSGALASLQLDIHKRIICCDEEDEENGIGKRQRTGI